MKLNSKIKFLLIILLSIAFIGCDPGFKRAQINPETNSFDTRTLVKQKDIKAYNLLPGIKQTKFVYLRTLYTSNDDLLFNFMSEGLKSIGIETVLNEKDLYDFILANNLSGYVTSITDPISLTRLAEVAPFLYIYCNLKLFGDCSYRFDLKVVDPLTNTSLLEASTYRLVMLSIDKEVNLPMLNLIKKWYDESAELEAPVVEPSIIHSKSII